MEQPRRRALGKGLEELFSTEVLDFDSLEEKIITETPKEEIVEIPLDELRSNPYQPRIVFDEEALNELAESIKIHGVFQPIIVKKSIKGYDIIAGERRFRASKMAGLEKIPAIIRDFTDEQMMEIALLENLQRENLSVIEEALAYKSMIEHLNLTQDDLSKKVGKSRSHVTNILGLLRLPGEVQQMVSDGRITMGHARALSKLESRDEIISLANRIVDENLVVRDVEGITSDNDVVKKVKINRKKSDSPYKYVEDLLRDKFDSKVNVRGSKIEIAFNGASDLNRILEILGIKDI